MDHEDVSDGRTVSDGRPREPSADINFEQTSGEFKISYSDRIADQHPELVDQSADWLEDQLGVLNLGQIDHKFLVADGVLTDEIKSGLIVWWSERVGDLDLG
jgi:hypothetical protein